MKHKTSLPLDDAACCMSFELPNTMEYTGKLYGKIGRRLIPLSMTSEEIDEAMRQNARIPRSGLALAELLARHCVIQGHAIDDAEDYDGCVTLDRIYAAHAEMISERKSPSVGATE